MEHFEEYEIAFPMPRSYVVAGYVAMIALAIALGSVLAILVVM